MLIMTEISGVTAPRVLTDVDVRRICTPDMAVRSMSDALIAHHRGSLVAPPRVSAPVGDARVVMTSGRTDDVYGYRVYDTIPTERDDQVVVVHDGRSGRVRGIAVGSLLGQYRTGALGAVAMRELGPLGPAHVTVVGGGAQAWAQVWAASCVLDVHDVTVTSRHSTSRDAFASRVRDELGLRCRAVENAEEAVSGADVVILATSSAVPVIDSEWLSRDVLVVTLGPKQVGRAEFALDLLDGAFVITDSVEQLKAYKPPALALQHEASPVPLGAIVAGDAAAQRTGPRVYLSVGLAGSEVVLLDALLGECAS